MNNQLTNFIPIHYYLNGNVKLEIVNINDFESSYNEYYENGNLKLKTPLHRNLKSGVEKEYYECGNLKTETNFFMGKQTDTKKRYFKNGVLKRQKR